jgi:hexosaminidase
MPALDGLHTSDEAYTLVVGPGNATLAASTVWGALRGLETFYQLVVMTSPPYLVHTGTVSDRPRFAWRGLMLDTARHFFPVSFIKQTLDGMAANKLSVFHWHLTDAESFPVVLPSAPELADHGAYDLTEASYSLEDLRAVVAHARLRGVCTPKSAFQQLSRVAQSTAPDRDSTLRPLSFLS